MQKIGCVTKAKKQLRRSTAPIDKNRQLNKKERRSRRKEKEPIL